MAEERKEDFVLPRTSICETKEAVVLEAEMPGVGKDGVEVNVKGDELEIIGRREAEEKKMDYLSCERCTRNYRRVFVLSDVIDGSKINAKMENGVLTLTLSKREELKPKKIEIE